MFNIYDYEPSNALIFFSSIGKRVAKNKFKIFKWNFSEILKKPFRIRNPVIISIAAVFCFGNIVRGPWEHYVKSKMGYK